MVISNSYLPFNINNILNVLYSIFGCVCVDILFCENYTCKNKNLLFCTFVFTYCTLYFVLLTTTYIVLVFASKICVFGGYSNKRLNENYLSFFKKKLLF